MNVRLCTLVLMIDIISLTVVGDNGVYREMSLVGDGKKFLYRGVCSRGKVGERVLSIYIVSGDKGIMWFIFNIIIIYIYIYYLYVVINFADLFVQEGCQCIDIQEDLFCLVKYYKCKYMLIVINLLYFLSIR